MSGPHPGVPCDHAKRANIKNSVLRELREMQKVAYDRVMDHNTEDKDVAQLLRAYVTAEQQRNILKMKPVPKPIDVTILRPKTQMSMSKAKLLLAEPDKPKADNLSGS